MSDRIGEEASAADLWQGLKIRGHLRGAGRPLDRRC
jgi:hypothetical protein